MEWSPADFRFTQKGNTLYAYQMRPSEDGKAVIRSLASGKARRIAAVRLLGQGSVPFEQTGDGLTLTLPSLLPSDGPHGFAISQE